MSNQSKIRIIRLWCVPFIDSTGINNLKSFIQKSINQEIMIILSGANQRVRNSLMNNKIDSLVEPDQICDDINAALDRARKIINQKTVK